MKPPSAVKQLFLRLQPYYIYLRIYINDRNWRYNHHQPAIWIVPTIQIWMMCGVSSKPNEPLR